MYVMSLSINGVISPVRTYGTVGVLWTFGLRGVDRTVGLVLGPDI